MKLILKVPAALLLFLFITAHAQDHFCPPEDLVKQNEKNVKAFENDKLYWRIVYKGWPYADEIGFDQVLFFPSKNKIDCRYHWTNPKDPGTFLWTSVILSPDAHSYVEISGNNWEDKGEVISCTGARPQSCAFEIKSGKKK